MTIAHIASARLPGVSVAILANPRSRQPGGFQAQRLRFGHAFDRPSATGERTQKFRSLKT